MGTGPPTSPNQQRSLSPGPSRRRYRNVDGHGDRVRVQILTPEGVLGRVKRFGLVRELTDLGPGIRVYRSKNGEPVGSQSLARHAKAARDELDQENASGLSGARQDMGTGWYSNPVGAIGLEPMTCWL